MDFFQIDCFLRVAEFQNYTLAAKSLFVAQSTVSKRILKLEEELGVALFHRETGTVELTAAGKEFLRFADDVAKRHEEMQQALKGLEEGYEGKLSIGTIPAVSFSDFNRYVSAFIQNNLSIQTNLVESDQMHISRKLYERKLDFAFIRDFRVHPDFTKFYLGDDEYVYFCACDHPFAHQRGLDPHVLNGLEMVLLDECSAIHGIVLSFFDQLEVTPKIIAYNSRHEVLMDLILLGNMCTCLPKEFLHSHLDKKICYFTVDRPLYSRRVLVRNRHMPLRREDRKFLSHMAPYIVEGEEKGTTSPSAGSQT